jgi:2-methylisocitrate lyase-like PEP mutase family enzyme
MRSFQLRNNEAVHCAIGCRMKPEKDSTKWRDLLDRHHPLVLPGAYDAISARLIEASGFAAYFVGGFPVVGARYALPDIGLVGFGEMADSVRDIMQGSSLPVLVDIDDGYGDAKNVSRTIRCYERMGVSAVHIEDQLAPKRCGHIGGKALISTEAMEAKIRAAVAARSDTSLFIVARTDARDVEGLDAALRRGERYLRAGADGLFIESPRSVDELTMIGRAFDAPLLANMLEGGATPILSNRVLHELGFAMVIHGITLLMRAVRTMRETLFDLREDNLDPARAGISFEDYKTLVGFGAWAEIEDRFEQKRR